MEEQPTPTPAFIPALTPAQQRGIEALLACSTISAAAEQAGVNRSTLYRWLQDETFCNVLQQSQSDAVAAVGRRMATLAAKALDTLNVAMDDVDPKVAVSAASTVLRQFAPITALADLDRRLRAIEGGLHVDVDGPD